jgi:hypothetical protein
MSYYADIDADGRVKGFYLDGLNDVPQGAVPISDDVWEAWIGDTVQQRWNGTALVPCDPPAVPPAPPIRKIRSLAFRERLPEARRKQITAAAVAAASAGDATMLTWLMDQVASTETDLDDPRVVAGAAAMRAASIISQAEHDALLANGTPQER